ncbi:hypothetical protein [Siccibacter colletis]
MQWATPHRPVIVGHDQPDGRADAIESTMLMADKVAAKRFRKALRPIA